MLYFVKILIWYGVFQVLQLINAERSYSYTIPREELQPVMDKLVNFAACNSNSTTGTFNYEFFFTTDRHTNSCSPYRLLQKDLFIDLLQYAINKTIDIVTSEQGEPETQMSVKLIRDPNTFLPAQKGQGDIKIIRDPNTLLPTQTGQGDTSKGKGTTTEAPTEISSTLDPLQEEYMREKNERNSYIASIITGVLVAVMLGALIGCACAQYVKTLRQSGAYVVNNP